MQDTYRSRGPAPAYPDNFRQTIGCLLTLQVALVGAVAGTIQLLHWLAGDLTLSHQIVTAVVAYSIAAIGFTVLLFHEMSRRIDIIYLCSERPFGEIVSAVNLATDDLPFVRLFIDPSERHGFNFSVAISYHSRHGALGTTAFERLKAAGFVVNFGKPKS